MKIAFFALAVLCAALACVDGEVWVRDADLHVGGNIQISLAVTESQQFVCIYGTRGRYFNTSYHDFQQCGTHNNFTSIYLGTCQFPVSVIEGFQNFLIWTTEADNNTYFEAQAHDSTNHNIILYGNVTGNGSPGRLIPLCCGSNWQTSLTIMNSEDFRWGFAALTGEIYITFSIVIIYGTARDILVVASRDCQHGNRDNSLVWGEPVGESLYRVLLSPQHIRRFGPGVWYLTVVSQDPGHPVEFSYSYSYTAIPWHECPRNCLGQGYCNTTTGLCHCNPCHSGPECEIVESCSNYGVCNYTGDGHCKCLAGATGDKCQNPPPPNEIPHDIYHDNLTKAGLTFLILGMIVVGIIVGLGISRYRSRALTYSTVSS